jgi:multiple sugar transport system ATP-binding protein
MIAAGSQRSPAMATVTFEHIEKHYGDFHAVHDFNLEINDGEFMVLVGPSGCGKTTNLRMVAGLEEISGGQLRIGDRVVNDVPPKDRDIAMVFQSYALYPHMTVRDNLAFGLKLRKVDKAEINRRVDEAAGILDLVSNLLYPQGGFRRQCCARRQEKVGWLYDRRFAGAFT